MGFQSFWSEFRQAVIDNDKAKIASMTRFPFKVRGLADSDPVKQYDRTGFLSIYERLVVQRVYLPEAGHIVAKSMRELIAGKSDITPEDFLTKNVVRFQQFEFERSKGRWWFTRAYLEE
ncbi:MAG TPA: hypothetical protein VNP04_02495 [Alphaproteobacteria bacterium]|nr:hypothetical protein [Alphaproteobacteria bacterium]